MNQTTDSADTRQALLDAARELFAEHGFSGTSVRAITAAAKANLGAVTYHFGSKDGLYDVVVADTLGPLASALLDAARGPIAPLDRVEAVVRHHFEYMITHKELAQLMLRSVMRSGQPPAAALASLRDVLQALAGIIRDGQADGSIRAGDPALMGFGLISQSVHLVIMQHALRDGLGIDLEDQAQRARVADGLARFARAGVAATSEAA